ncbi:cell division protein PerM [Nakamurella endophytica]|uniref:Uncharacterized protein n=1 Tax=Nakamurella endophytica TaxID=1748367 RepID=A0A917SXC9_9ACTN|nr:DUF6350 family protein [Nakamurella endophytica]GGM02588.1 hypothetical protein GCM10011594_23370 [Nakamurella endophytica]
MTLLDAGHRPAVSGAPPDTSRDRRPPASTTALVVVAAAVRALAAVLAALVLTVGIALLLWAVTPASGSSPLPALRAGAIALAAGHGMDVRIGDATLTLPPLLLGVLAVSLLWGAVGRGRVVPAGVGQETAAILVTGILHGAAVTAVPVLLQPGRLSPDQWWRPAILAWVTVGLATVVRGAALRALLVRVSPSWVTTALRLAAVAVAAVLGGSALVLAAASALSFGAAAHLVEAGGGGADAFGLTVLSLAFLPNAVIAVAGYASGVGFDIGAGHYSPFGSLTADLPGIPLLAAVPDRHPAGGLGLVALAVPVAAGLLAGVVAARRLASRADRVRAAAAAGGLAGLAVGALAWLAAGGVTPGRWLSAGAPPVLTAVLLAVEVGAVGAAVAAVVPARAVSGDADARATDAAADAESDTPDATAPGAAAEADQDAGVTDGAESAVAAHADAPDAGSAEDAADESAADPRAVVADAPRTGDTGPDVTHEDRAVVTAGGRAAEPSADEGPADTDTDRDTNPDPDPATDTDAAAVVDDSTGEPASEAAGAFAGTDRPDGVLPSGGGDPDGGTSDVVADSSGTPAGTDRDATADLAADAAADAVADAANAQQTTVRDGGAPTGQLSTPAGAAPVHGSRPLLPQQRPVDPHRADRAAEPRTGPAAD